MLWSFKSDCDWNANAHSRPPGHFAAVAYLQKLLDLVRRDGNRDEDASAHRAEL